LKAIRLPKALPEDLRRIIGVQLGQLFPLAADQLSFDFIQTSNQDQEGFLTLVGAIRAEDLRLLYSELKEVGLTARRVLPIAMASPVIAAKAGQIDALVIEQDHGDTALDVVQGSFLRFSRVTPVGSEVAVEIKRTLAAAGAGDIPVLRSEATPGTLGLLHEAPGFDFELSESRLLHAKQRTATRTKIAIASFMVAIALTGFLWFQQHQALSAVQKTKSIAQVKLTVLQSEETELSSSASQLGTVRDDLNHSFVPGQHLADICAYVSDSLPAGAWLTGLTAERGKAIQVRGTAMSAGQVTSFVDRLGSSTRFANVKLLFANSALIGTTPVIEFNVSADCVGNLSLPTPSKNSDTTEQASSASQPDVDTGTGG
jgi:hypothetical protein